MEAIIVNTGSAMQDLQKGYVAIDISTATISGVGYSQEVITASFAGSCNFNTFSNGGFSEFETRIVSAAGLISDTWLPQNSYGMDYARIPNGVVGSNAITPAEKVALSILLNCRTAGYYVAARVSTGQNAYITLLNSFSIPIW